MREPHEIAEDKAAAYAAARRAAQIQRARDAAARTMLAALKALANVSRSYIEHMDADDIDAVEDAHAAIAQAEAAGIKSEGR